ncbi:LAFA_0G03158g1_1 [Lachancea sp. 'fantastica']|nr:LAFA_0G03158g1_1 [Lachancea sp. 'fantastica']
MVDSEEVLELKTCSRCRRNKIRCDYNETKPNSCTACSKRCVKCIADYVVPHKRSHELSSIVQGVNEVVKVVDDIYCEYEIMAKECVKACGEAGIVNGEYSSSKVLKVGKDVYVLFTLGKETLSINNCAISVASIDRCLNDFGELVGEMLKMYATWEAQQEIVSDIIVGQRSSRYCLKTLFENEELPLLLCLINFYFQIPGLDYERTFDLILNDFCSMAVDDKKSGICYDRASMATFIVGRTREIGGTHFNGEVFVKKLTLYLFYHIVLYGFEKYMTAFMSKYIRTLEQVRKKINIEKNWEVKWVNFYIKIFDLVGSISTPMGFGNIEVNFLKVIEFDCEYMWGKGYIGTFSDVCRRNFEEFKWFMEIGITRIPFFKMFVAQFVSLNLVLAENNEGSMTNIIGNLGYNGFNVKERNEDSNVSSSVRSNELEQKFKMFESFEEREVLRVVFRGVAERSVEIEDLDLFEVFVVALTDEGCGMLRQRCCCKIIRDLFENVVVSSTKESLEVRNVDECF